jgi:hypothetical protein
MEAALIGTLSFRSGPDGRNSQLWSGSGGGLQGRGRLSAAGKGSPRRLKTVCRCFSSTVKSGLGRCSVRKSPSDNVNRVHNSAASIETSAL